jgi:hypothetical protein
VASSPQWPRLAHSSPSPARHRPTAGEQRVLQATWELGSPALPCGWSWGRGSSVMACPELSCCPTCRCRVKESWLWLQASGLPVHITCANSYLTALIREVCE